MTRKFNNDPNLPDHPLAERALQWLVNTRPGYGPLGYYSDVPALLKLLDDARTPSDPAVPPAGSNLDAIMAALRNPDVSLGEAEIAARRAVRDWVARGLSDPTTITVQPVLPLDQFVYFGELARVSAPAVPERRPARTARETVYDAWIAAGMKPSEAWRPDAGEVQERRKFDAMVLMLEADRADRAPPREAAPAGCPLCAMGELRGHSPRVHEQPEATGGKPGEEPTDPDIKSGTL